MEREHASHQLFAPIEAFRQPQLDVDPRAGVRRRKRQLEVDPPTLDHAIGRDPDSRFGKPGRPRREPEEQRNQETGPDRDQRRLRGREAGEEPSRGDDEPDDGALLERHDDSSRTGTGTDATAARTASAGSIRCTQSSGASVSLCARAGMDTALMSSGVTKSRPRYAARARASF